MYLLISIVVVCLYNYNCNYEYLRLYFFNSGFNDVSYILMFLKSQGVSYARRKTPIFHVVFIIDKDTVWKNRLTQGGIIKQ